MILIVLCYKTLQQTAVTLVEATLTETHTGHQLFDSLTIL